MRNWLKESKDEIRSLKIENGNLKQVINMNILQSDDLQQYPRPKIIRIYGITEAQFEADDGEKVIMEIAKELKIQLEDNDIQRAHRLGKRKKSATKARPIIFIACFVSCKKEMNFSSIDLHSKTQKLQRSVYC